MTDNYSFPITPPPELVRRWLSEEYERGLAADHVATQAARWGSDQELKACREWLKLEGHEYEHEALLAARRPKPPSLKKQAMRVLLESGYTLDGRMEIEPEDIDIIHRALEQLSD
jgi:hypothetical protein